MPIGYKVLLVLCIMLILTVVYFFLRSPKTIGDINRIPKKCGRK